MALTTSAALWFLPFVLPLCFYVCFTDLREMRITNQAVLALAAVFVVVGLIALPLPVYGLRLLQLVGVLVVGFLLTAAGTMGAGDAKFAAAAAPFVAPGDLRLLLALFAANLLAAFAAHRIAKHSPLRRIAPEWKSWNTGRQFPMGLALGTTLALYLILALFFGA
ncbi:prepilin peptidase [Pseudodonghicola flavimaris]|uniref:Prepilin peptidase n=1 Tax=Pseudodonghicola flavimaris TaxID=3050036 RepID=A0ABT7EXQ7_9RHOB|nr:prepilin peptidase [Pseudodonghicola flavimaris]MDK3017131.1 prepilin peptidase [Pseudodonghicola flavimaris]